MEFETYADVIDAYNSGVAVEQGESLTDYIKRNNIKIKEIEMSPLGDLEKTLGSRDQDSGIMATDDARLMASPSGDSDSFIEERGMASPSGDSDSFIEERGMAEYQDPFLKDEYDKYVFDMLEQGLEPMSFDEFRRAALAGQAKAPTEEIEEEIKEKKVISLAGGGISELLEA